MKIFGLIVLILVLAGVIVYANGASLPVNHSVSVSGVVPAPPDRVFDLITKVANGPSWRPELQSVVVLRPDQGRDHWVEYLPHHQFMTFLAVRTDPPRRRDVVLDDANAAYGGSWIYELSPGPSPNSTTLHITENGFIRPPVYRFIMAHVFGPTHNLDQYMADIQKAAAAKP